MLATAATFAGEWGKGPGIHRVCGVRERHPVRGACEVVAGVRLDAERRALQRRRGL